jgi:6-phosphogluconolactonase
MEVRVNPDAGAAAADAADLLARRILRAVHDRGRCHIAVSGGGTPEPMFRALAERDLPWDRLHVHQVDERVAPRGDPARNVGMLSVLPLPAGNLHPMPVERARLTVAARAYAALLPERLDVVHLGIGDDGHTASWPPGDPVIDSPDPVALSAPYQGLVRMTLTPPVVNAARSRLVLIAGRSKAAAVRRWLLGDDNLPVQRVRRAGTTVVLDTAAAGELGPVHTR